MIDLKIQRFQEKLSKDINNSELTPGIILLILKDALIEVNKLYIESIKMQVKGEETKKKEDNK